MHIIIFSVVESNCEFRWNQICDQGTRCSYGCTDNKCWSQCNGGLKHYINPDPRTNTCFKFLIARIIILQREKIILTKMLF